MTIITMNIKENSTIKKSGIKSELVQEGELQNTQSDEDEEVNYLAKMIIERLEAKEKANKYLKNFKIK